MLWRSDQAVIRTAATPGTATHLYCHMWAALTTATPPTYKIKGAHAVALLQCRRTQSGLPPRLDNHNCSRPCHRHDFQGIRMTPPCAECGDRFVHCDGTHLGEGDARNCRRCACSVHGLVRMRCACRRYGEQCQTGWPLFWRPWVRLCRGMHGVHRGGVQPDAPPGSSRGRNLQLTPGTGPGIRNHL